MIDYKLISADDHMDLWSLPPDLFVNRVPAKMRDRAPQVVDMPQGKMWKAGESVLGPSGRARGSTVRMAVDKAGLENADTRPSTPALRLQDMDRDHIEAEVIYGAVRGFSIADVEVKEACVRAYNDWALEFNAQAPQRLCVLSYLPVHSPEASVKELRRVAAAGHRGTVFEAFQASAPIWDARWSAMWQAVEETGLPLSVHLGSGTSMLKNTQGSWEFPAFVTVAPMQMDEALAALIFNGSLERHPNFKLVLGESGLGWLPYVIERLDREQDNHGAGAKDYRIQMRASEIFRRQVYATFEEDTFGVKHCIPAIGEDNVMWASDYPHPDSTFPHSRESVERDFAGVDARLTRKVVRETAAKLYGFKA
ncbi:MAG: amidohydrolase [Dehalococcoidia bacterium]|nr:amidohydrolase [Dehalococcoidia bacterium]